MTTPLPNAFRGVQASVDADMRRVLEGAARRIRRRIERAGVGIGAEIRTAQLRMVLAEIGRVIGDTWTGPVVDATQAGRKAASEAAEEAVEALTAVAYTALPPDVAKALTDGLGAAARSSIANAFARVPRPLSARVYHNAALARGHVERTIREGMAAGLTAKELARDVYQYVSPTTPGGMSYAAMRLARTEINNAFHERQKAGANRPGVKAVKWNLSGSHKVPDECNVYAAHKPYDKDAVPDKPHPQCFCYLTYVMMSPDEFAEALSSGSFDDELDRRTRENMARLGREATPAPTPKRERPTPTEKRAAAGDDAGRDPLNRVEGEGRNRVQEVLDRNRELVPSAFRERFNGVYLMDGKQARAFAARFGPTALGGYTVESSEVGIHPQVLKPKYQREYERDKRSGFLSRTGDDALRSFVAHETGHHVDKVLKERGPAGVKAVWSVIAEAAGVPRPLLVDQTSLDRWVAKHRTEIEKVVSRYGGEDAGELIAEVWAEFIDGPNPRPAIRKIGKAIVNAIEG